jgi:hypothetical protein
MPVMPIAVPRYFTVAEVARALGVAQQRFRAMVDAGKGPTGDASQQGKAAVWL